MSIISPQVVELLAVPLKPGSIMYDSAGCVKSQYLFSTRFYVWGYKSRI